jgi:hypothetical protein
MKYGVPTSRPDKEIEKGRTPQKLMDEIEGKPDGLGLLYESRWENKGSIILKVERSLNISLSYYSPEYIKAFKTWKEKNFRGDF